MTDARRRLVQGGRIDRARPLGFTFNGHHYTGFAGDTLASALLAHGVSTVARSFKYHRPRGIMTAGAEEPNALVQVGEGARTEPNLRATQVALYEGLVATSVNAWPGVGFDVGAINGLFARLMPAGFYYKTFMWPARFWPRYEHVIRHAAGLGVAPEAPDPDRYDHRHAHCDLLVAGGGPAGLAAALAAGRAGARVILVDEQDEFGGALLGLGAEIDGAPATDWVAATVAELAAMTEVRLLPRATVFGYYDHNYIGVFERVGDHLAPGSLAAGMPRHRLWKVRAKRVVLATGAHERPLVFANNDRPGVMMASAARTYVNRYAVKPGARAVIFANNDSAHGAALDLAEAGIAIAAVVDPRADPQGPAVDALRGRGIEVLGGSAVIDSHGGKRLTGVEVARLDETAGAVKGAPRRVSCDLLCISGGWNPAVHLFSQSRGRLRFDDDLACFLPDKSFYPERSAGACNGAFALAACLAEGHAAGAEAAAAAGFEAPPAPARDAPEPPAAPMRPLWRVPAVNAAAHGAKHFVDYQNDVTAADIEVAAREGYQSIEHLKRYTTTGMGTDQGKTSNVNALALMAEIKGAEIAAVGTTTFRPPYTPISYGTLAGRAVGPLWEPARITAMHQWHAANGAVFEDVGQWKRPWYYPRAGETMADAVNRECRAVRQGVGIVDATTLGKIDLRGRDVLELLNRLYTNAWDKLAIGRCRYGLMLGEDGMVFDDGVTSRLGEHHYHMTTTTGGAARVLGWIEEWLQTEWPKLRVFATSVTTHWSVVSIAGPEARALLAELCDDIDLAREAFPFMSWRDGTVAGIPARVFRVSFSGEVAFEINVRASYGVALWQALMAAGEKYDITPYGTEAMHVLRAEKGFIVVGHDTDGTVTPGDLGMDWIVSKKKKDFIGKRSLARADIAREGRKQLVGLLTEDPREVLPEGGQIVAELKPKPPMPMIGHVTSSYWSPVLERSIAMALLENGHARHGETITVALENKPVRALVTAPQFYDIDGERIRG